MPTFNQSFTITQTWQLSLSATSHYSTKYEHLKNKEKLLRWRRDKTVEMYIQKFILTVEHLVEFPWWGVFDEIRSYPHLRFKPNWRVRDSMNCILPSQLWKEIFMFFIPFLHLKWARHNQPFSTRYFHFLGNKLCKIQDGSDYSAKLEAPWEK